MSMYIHIYVYIHLINYPQQDNLETFKVFCNSAGWSNHSGMTTLCFLYIIFPLAFCGEHPFNNETI